MALTSTPCPACGLALTSTWRTFHGSSPALARSRKTQRLPASLAASMTARPVAMWSAWLAVPGPHDSWWLIVISTSGRCRLMAAAKALRSGRPYSSVPSGNPRNSTSVTPTSAAPARSSASRTGPHSSGGRSSMPASPLVARQ